MRLTVLQPPRCLPLSALDVVTHARGLTSTDDALLAACQRGAVSWIEGYTWRALVGQRLQETWDDFYAPGRISGRLPLGRSPVQGVESVRYLDVNGAAQTVTAADYKLAFEPRPLVLPAYAVSWPTARDEPDAVTVTYRAGYLEPVLSVSSGADTVTLEGRTPAAGDALPLSGQLGATAPGGLELGVTYYAVNPSGSTTQLAATPGGAAINITTNGTGQLFVGALDEDLASALRLLTTGLYEQRTPSVVGTVTADLPYGLSLESLLAPHRPARF